MTDHLVGAAEIAKMLGVSRQRVNQLVDSYADFPRPQSVLAAGRIWSRHSVEAWIAVHPERLPGRPEESMPFEAFNQPSRQVVAGADKEARALRHGYKGTEHLFLGILSGRRGPAAAALESVGVTLDGARQSVEELIGRGNQSIAWPELPFSPRARETLKRAAQIAPLAGPGPVRPEHILFSMIEEEESVAHQVLTQLGIDVGDLDKKVRDLVGLPIRLNPDDDDTQRTRLRRIESVLVQLTDVVDSLSKSIRSIESRLQAPSQKRRDPAAKSKGRK